MMLEGLPDSFSGERNGHRDSEMPLIRHPERVLALPAYGSRITNNRRLLS